jgi:hypothetical protein
MLPFTAHFRRLILAFHKLTSFRDITGAREDKHPSGHVKNTLLTKMGAHLNFWSDLLGFAWSAEHCSAGFPALLVIRHYGLVISTLVQFHDSWKKVVLMGLNSFEFCFQFRPPQWQNTPSPRPAGRGTG